MSNKEFVLKHCPTATIEAQRTRGAFSKTYYLVRERGEQMYMAEGDTKAKAWAAAAETVAERIVKAAYPDAELLQPKTGLDFVIYDPISCVVLSKSIMPAKAWIKAAELVEKS